MRFNCETVLIPYLQDRVVYTAFLNGLLPGTFKFSLAESNVTTLAYALRRADFIQAIKICTRDGSVHQEARNRMGIDKDLKKDEERGGHFHTSPQNIFMDKERGATLC